MNDDDKIKSWNDALKSLFEEAKIGADDFAAGFANMVGGAEDLARQFTNGRMRMTELMGAVTDAAPAVDRLGGNLKDAVETMKSVSEATRRNVIAGTEDVSKLYAAYKVTGVEVETIVNSFQEVGVEFTQVGKQLEDSIQYVQRVGGNAKQIMGSVLNDMSALNKFNFQSGVEGLTKMATQASMLKFDMRQTLDFADKVIDPENAIEMASAFQRLGVSVGDLTDPFMLMNKGLNDPGGLQDSLVEMSKEFTYFDEKTKSFKINPQGMLMMREIGKQTGLSSAELSKMALNAADLDKKLSQIRPTLNFEDEEDKKLLANIASMGKSGQYEVRIGDEQVKLEEITQSQLDKLIEEQKKGPKTLEDLQRSQLDAFKLVKADVASIKDKVVLGIVSPQTVRREAEGARQVLGAGSRAIEENVEMDFFRKGAQKSLDTMMSLVSQMNKGDFFGPESQKLLENAFKDLKEVEGKVDDKTRDVIESFMRENAGNNSEIGKLIQDYMKKQYDESQLKKEKPTTSTTAGRSATMLDETIRTTSEKTSSKLDVNNSLTNETNTRISDLSTSIKNSKGVTTKDGDEIKSIISEESITSLMKVYSQGADNMLTKLTTVIENLKISPVTVPTTGVASRATNLPTLSNTIQPVSNAVAQTNSVEVVKKMVNATTNTNNNNYSIGFDANQPATVNVNVKLSSDGKIDATMVANIIDMESMKEKITNTVVGKLKEVEFQPLIDAMSMG